MNTGNQLMSTVEKCLEACNHCFEACLEEEDIDMLRKCIRTDRECADMCSIVLSYKGREESLPQELVSLCAQICTTCGKECEHHEHMNHCQQCAEACFSCAKACREFVAA